MVMLRCPLPGILYTSGSRRTPTGCTPRLYPFYQSVNLPAHGPSVYRKRKVALCPAALVDDDSWICGRTSCGIYVILIRLERILSAPNVLALSFGQP